MNYLFSNESKADGAASKLPLVAKKLTKDEIRELTKGLTYLIPGMFTSMPKREIKGKHGSKRKGKRGGRGEDVKFPSPEKASQLNKPYNIFQEYSGGTAASSTIMDALGALNVKFSDDSQSAQLAAVFDQYRIAMVEVTFMPRVNVNTEVALTPPVFYSVVDLDDSSTTSVSSLTNYPGVQVTEAYKPHKHTFIPHVAVAVYSGAFTSFANEEAPWVDVASPDVQHYGIKWGFTTTTPAYTYDLRVRVHLQLRNVR